MYRGLLENLKPCIFCGEAENLEILTLQGYYAGLITTTVSCGNCGVEGPSANENNVEDMDEAKATAHAIELWNKAHGNG